MGLTDDVLLLEHKLAIADRKTIVHALLQLPGGAASLTAAYIRFLQNASLLITIAASCDKLSDLDGAPNLFEHWRAAGDVAAAIRQFFVLAVHEGNFCGAVRRGCIVFDFDSME